MSGYSVELLDLIARWVHVIAGIMWIGNSLLFNWLDRNLRPRAGETP
ncbi:MAG: urate hydroxylase PuuD, partial [Gemmatimonadaceae bacterium]